MIEKPLELKFHEICIGQINTFQIKITEKMVDDFANFSGDYNPLHMDQNFAKSKNFKNRVCHGMLLSSFFSRLIGMYLPGKNSLYFSQTINFQLPCYVNQKITVSGEVKEIIPSIKTIVLETKIFNDSEDCLIDGIANVIMQ
jgi:3-hydroxybutyryl-CoA dehydratase|tara:strand:+ start:1345 stop:1770 length:426 start_codon:yes stop_codon:yes gene_type:complete